MTVRVPNGALIAIESGSAAAVNITGITNANPAVVTTSAAHGLTTGDFVEIVSGWSRLTNKIVRITMLTSTTFSVDNLDTTLTSIYPAGAGTGTVAKVSGWTQLSQILSVSTSGGEQNFLTYQLLEADAQKQIPTFKTPYQITMSVADDPALPGFVLAGVANDDRLPRGVRVTLPDGSQILYNAYISLNRTPSLTVNELMACQVTLSLLAEPTRY
ncbi:MAG: phage tail protein [Proteobacteria bacterium]|nr:phage tail protein [Pseudomonadota bacterium]